MLQISNVVELIYGDMGAVCGGIHIRDQYQ